MQVFAVTFKLIPLKHIQQVILATMLMVSAGQLSAQMVTGVWKGKINRQKVEVKIIQKGDSITGTSYYYESPGNFRRYSIKGYFDGRTNEVVWWDDQLLEEKTGRMSLSSPGRIPQLASADFNCPGDGRMMLDGKSARKDGTESSTTQLHLDKIVNPVFPDEWDFVIDNYTIGANDPNIIDSIGMLAGGSPVVAPPPARTVTEGTMVIIQPVEEPVARVEPVKVEPVEIPVKVQTIEEKYVSRKKIPTIEIPLVGDSIELRFYDNAEIDGDSISLFLNGRMIFQHIRLTGKAYMIKLAISELQQENELIMVAENLGSIPPNTSYMYAIMGEKRYEAMLESTEGSSAMVRLYK